MTESHLRACKGLSSTPALCIGSSLSQHSSSCSSVAGCSHSKRLGYSICLASVDLVQNGADRSKSLSRATAPAACCGNGSGGSLTVLVVEQGLKAGAEIIWAWGCVSGSGTLRG